jgi:hypothetical protein
MISVPRHTKDFVAGSILILCFIWSCDDREPCTGCGEVTSSLSQKRFQVVIDEWDTLLIQHDSSERTSTSFQLCFPETLIPFESQNIVEVSGSFRIRCEEPDRQQIDVNEITWISTCLPPIPQLNGPYFLDNRWLIHYIQTQDTLLYPPCEGEGFIDFDDIEQNIHTHPSLNSCMGTYTIINDSTLQMPADFGCTLSVGNSSQRYFENIFDDVITRDAHITFSINNNILILRNKAENSMVRLFLIE